MDVQKTKSNVSFLFSPNHNIREKIEIHINMYTCLLYIYIREWM